MRCRRKADFTVGLAAAILILSLPATAPGQGHAPGKADRPPSSDAENAEQLRAVGYSAWSEAGATSALSGVTRNEPAKSYRGYNLYTDYTDAAYLMDMEGKIVHTWKFPAGEGADREFARMLPDGSLLSLGKTLVKQAWDGAELWRLSPKLGDAFTHDLEVLGDGSLLALSIKDLEYNGFPAKMETIEHLSVDHTLHCSWSSETALDELHHFHPPTPFDGNVNPESRNYYQTAKVRVDYYHANTLRLLPDIPLGHKDRRFRKGNWMICLRQVGLVAILDQTSKKVVWGWGPGVLDHPHSPVMLPTGEILVFDNGMDRGYSRLLKVDPLTSKVTWTYEAKPRSSFFTAERGFVQPLPNGNMLVTLSGKGQALELTGAGEIVWEFYHPDIKGDTRRAIYRLVRYPAAMVEPLLGK
jgi:hypothetical protein